MNFSITSGPVVKIEDIILKILEPKMKNLFQPQGLENPYFNQSPEIEISGLSFTLSGELLNGARSIRLRNTHSYSAETVVIPSSVANTDAQGLLSRIMENYNSKLSSSHIG